MLPPTPPAPWHCAHERTANAWEPRVTSPAAKVCARGDIADGPPMFMPPMLIPAMFIPGIEPRRGVASTRDLFQGPAHSNDMPMVVLAVDLRPSIVNFAFGAI